MTPKETAFKLYFEFYRDIIANSKKAKECAIVTVKKIIDIKTDKDSGIIQREDFLYWVNVINEINKL